MYHVLNSACHYGNHPCLKQLMVAIVKNLTGWIKQLVPTEKLCLSTLIRFVNLSEASTRQGNPSCCVIYLQLHFYEEINTSRNMWNEGEITIVTKLIGELIKVEIYCNLHIHLSICLLIHSHPPIHPSTYSSILPARHLFI